MQRERIKNKLRGTGSVKTQRGDRRMFLSTCNPLGEIIPPIEALPGLSTQQCHVRVNLVAVSSLVAVLVLPPPLGLLKDPSSSPDGSHWHENPNSSTAAGFKEAGNQEFQGTGL
ncbi:hypothetical protein CRG98_044404 [Punica granatum]|uniref:Uncharacterized protein n=1 Tax=Punica granatum TaxID=22663 RepID=A0A2I0HU64_PUNGR|nr:hypothetical protein CRG98_044404 [Punica granatum]